MLGARASARPSAHGTGCPLHAEPQSTLLRCGPPLTSAPPDPCAAAPSRARVMVRAEKTEKAEAPKAVGPPRGATVRASSAPGVGSCLQGLGIQSAEWRCGSGLPLAERFAVVGRQPSLGAC